MLLKNLSSKTSNTAAGDKPRKLDSEFLNTILLSSVSSALRGWSRSASCPANLLHPRSKSSQICTSEVEKQYSTFEIPPSALCLVLAGDVGRLVDYKSHLAFLARQTQGFEKVFLVLGIMSSTVFRSPPAMPAGIYSGTDKERGPKNNHHCRQKETPYALLCD